MKDLLHNTGFDELDRVILEELQANGRISNADLARKVFLSAPAVHNRIKRLERSGIIRQYVALLDQEKVGYDLLCFVYINIENHSEADWQTFRDAIADMPHVIECYKQTGDYDAIMKVVARTREDLNKIIHQDIATIPGVCRVKTNMVIDAIKSTTAIALK
jgi:Lrp/AsnC family transcriptional regulator, leucine-responsive regulatory protein